MSASLNCVVEAFSTDGAVVTGNCTSREAATKLRDELIRRLKSQGVDGVAGAGSAGSEAARIRGQFVTIDEGSRWVRYFFGFLGAGKAVVEVEAELQCGDGPSHRLHGYRKQGRNFLSLGLFGGNSGNIVNVAVQKLAKGLAADVARVMKSH